MSVFMRLGSVFSVVLLLAACSSGGSSGSSACPSNNSAGNSELTTLIEACEAHTGIDGVNRAAIAMSSSVSANNGNACQELHQYNLFAPNEEEGFLCGDPRRPLVVEDQYQGLPYALNTALFSDYTAKHRIVFLPKDEDGEFIPAEYRDAGSSPDGTPGTGDLDKANDNLIFPVGTVIAKTFTYPDASDTGNIQERVIETRLLIKHTNTSDESASWEGVAYVWEQDENTGEWIARRDNLGLSALGEARNWHYPDPNDPGQIISGSNDEGENIYPIPSRQNCLQCHRNADQDAGAAPIGLKARFLNRPYVSEFDEFTADPAELTAGIGRNQIDFWADEGWLTEVDPAAYTLDSDTQVISDIERTLPYNLPLNSGDSEADYAHLTARARGYLEVNCAHCHNEVRGSVEDFYMEFQRDFCSANLFGQNRITPGEPDVSGDVHQRINIPRSETGGMPLLARELVHEEGAAVIREWIEQMPADICPD